MCDFLQNTFWHAHYETDTKSCDRDYGCYGYLEKKRKPFQMKGTLDCYRKCHMHSDTNAYFLSRVTV